MTVFISRHVTTFHQPLYDTLCLLFSIIFDYRLKRLTQSSSQSVLQNDVADSVDDAGATDSRQLDQTSARYEASDVFRPVYLGAGGRPVR
jgi:hypothetical protein